MDKELVYGALLEAYSRDPSMLSRLLDIALEVQELKAILDWNPLQQFPIDLACLASVRDALDLARWLDDCLQRLGASFAEVRCFNLTLGSPLNRILDCAGVY